MSIYKVSLSFTSSTDGELTPIASRIIDGLTGNASFPNLPFPPAELVTLRDNYAASLAKAKGGTTEDTLAKVMTRTALENALRQDAAYVQSQAAQNLQMLLSSGFEAASTNRTQIPLPQPVILRVENAGTSQLAVRAEPVPTARAYEARIRTATGEWQSAGVFTAATKILLTNLTPGTLYSIQIRAIGGSTGSSEWSDPVQHMSL